MTDQEFEEYRLIAVLKGNTLARISPRAYRAQLESLLYIEEHGRSKEVERMQACLRKLLNQ
jgi:hypothetical protein